ncbi:retrovirus-related pol polyprotein from transposon RE2 [Tanacetum coccineum]
MAEEYAALMRNAIWSLVSPIPNANVIDCKWVYKLKRDQTGAITRFKARLVAKGFNQQQGIDYFETFSPVVKSTTIHTVLSLEVTKRWTLRQLDVQNDFLHGELHETVYLRQPPDLGTLSYFLDVEVVNRNSDVILSQKKYILELLQRANFSKTKPIPSPITTTANLHLDDSPLFDDSIKYHQLVGALQYVTLSRPDITYAVNKVCQFMHSPTTNHWSAVKRIVCYLRGTSDYGLLIKHNSRSVLHAYTNSHDSLLSVFSDVDWFGCPADRRSTGDMPSISETNKTLVAPCNACHVGKSSKLSLSLSNIKSTYMDRSSS